MVPNSQTLSKTARSESDSLQNVQMEDESQYLNHGAAGT